MDYTSEQNQSFDIGDTLSRSWELFKENAGLLIGVMVVFGVVGAIFSGMGQALQVMMQQTRDEGVIAILLVGVVGVNFVSYLVQTVLSLGLIRIFLEIARGGQADFGMLFSGLQVLGTGIAANILLGIIVMLGTLACIVPGVYLTLGLWWTLFIVVDQRRGPIEALKESWRITEGERTNLFIWSLACFGIMLAGMLACCVGLFVAGPVIGIGNALIYVGMVQRKGAMA